MFKENQLGMENLKYFFQSVGFEGAELNAIIDAFILEHFEKNDFIVEEGKTSKYIGIIKSGLLHYYVIKDGEEKTSYVSTENTFFASLLSFISEMPSLENIKAITPCSLYILSKSNLKQLVNDVPKFKDFYISLLESSICGIDSSRHDLIVLTGEQRYEKMLRTEPHLLQKIPLQYLASMLGVTPRHLSRIRNNIR